MIIDSLPFFLLGRSRNVKSWVDGSVLWNDFGGNEKGGKEETAARELYEETLGTLISKEDIPILAQSLKNEQYVLRIDFDEAVVFIVKFEWSPKILFDFSKLRFQLKSIQKICAGFPLTSAERLELCKYKWMQSKNDSSLTTILSHPAVDSTRRHVPASVVDNAHQKLSQILHTSETTGSGPQHAVIVHGIRPHFMEMEVLHLFGFWQLSCCLKESGLCLSGQSIQISSSLKTVLKVLKSFFMGLADCADCEEECEKKAD